MQPAYSRYERFTRREGVDNARMSWRTRLRARLRELRDREGITQAQIAESIGCSAGTISNWVTGTREPEKLADFEKLARALKVPPEWLLYGIPTHDTEVTLLITKIGSLSQPQRDAIKALIDSFTA